MNFLNQETAFLNGPAKLAHKFKIPIIYLRQKKIRRGYYEAYFERYDIEGQSTDEIMDYICESMQNEIQKSALHLAMEPSSMETSKTLIYLRIIESVSIFAFSDKE